MTCKPFACMWSERTAEPAQISIITVCSPKGEERVRNNSGSSVKTWLAIGHCRLRAGPESCNESSKDFELTSCACCCKEGFAGVDCWKGTTESGNAAGHKLSSRRSSVRSSCIGCHLVHCCRPCPDERQPAHSWTPLAQEWSWPETSSLHP